MKEKFGHLKSSNTEELNRTLKNADKDIYSLFQRGKLTLD